jgi:hypothetical protein
VENSAGYYLVNWEEYSLTDDYKRRIEKKGFGYWKHSEKMGIYSEKDGTREENRIEKNRIVEDSFITSLKNNLAYKGIDIDKELNRMDAWLSLPRNKGRRKTHRFILNWLNRIDGPIDIPTPDDYEVIKHGS